MFPSKTKIASFDVYPTFKINVSFKKIYALITFSTSAANAGLISAVDGILNKIDYSIIFLYFSYKKSIFNLSGNSLTTSS